jgi:hypothetical protein
VRRIKRFTIPFLVLLGLMLTAVNPDMVWADNDDPIEIEFTGTVTAINEENRTITVLAETEDGSEEYLVRVPEDFDLDGVTVGDVVEVDGTLQDNGSVQAKTVKVEDEDDKDGDDDGGEGDHGHFCRNLDDPDIVHPVGYGIAERYDVDYEEVMTWFCEENMGFGQIMLALQTADGYEETYDELLDRRIAGEGWGEIWQDLGLIGRPKDAEPPEDAEGRLLNEEMSAEEAKPTKEEKRIGKEEKLNGADGNRGHVNEAGGPPEGVGRPDEAGGPPDNPGNSRGVTGRPDNADRPDQAGGAPNDVRRPNRAGGPPESVGRPDQAGGRPDNVGRPDQGGGPPENRGKPDRP